MKNYVMVPVPVEFEEEVRVFLMETDVRATAARTVTHVDTDSVARMLNVVNPECRTALIALADSAIAEQSLSIGELARNLRWTVHETVGVMQEAQELVWQTFGPKIALMAGRAPDADAGGVDWNGRPVVMWKEFATAVSAVADRERSDEA